MSEDEDDGRDKDGRDKERQGEDQEAECGWWEERSVG